MRPGKIFNSIKQRGQMLVLFALLIPIILIFVGLGIDIGWYYLNVSRLQNAADAASRAGALKIVDKEENPNMNNFYSTRLLTTPPTDLMKFTKVYHVQNSFTIGQNQGPTNGTEEQDAIANMTKTYTTEDIKMDQVEEVSKIYANKNLNSSTDGNTIMDSWNTSKKTSDHKVTFESALYSKIIDVERQVNGIRYYMVKLSEDIPHFFLPGWFKPMKATVVAYSILNPHGTDLVTINNRFEKTNVIANWEYQNKFKNTNLKWNHYRQTVGKTANGKTILYASGDNFRTEKVTVLKNGGSINATDANGNKKYSEMEVDSLNLDFNQEVNFSKTIKSDWDLGAEVPEGATVINRTGVNIDANTHKVLDEDSYAYNMRVHASLNINDKWKDRNLNDLQPDILWTRIESEPMWTELFKNDGTVFKDMSKNGLNSVRQIFLNFNQDNTEVTTVTDAEGNKHKVYQYRPMYFIYMGPEVYSTASLVDPDKTFSEDTSVRKSQPVVINFNADFNGVIYMPNSPVVINGNGHKFKGFVIAKEYLKLKEASDFTSNGYLSALDEYGHTIFFQKNTAISESEFETLRETYAVNPDSDNGIFSVYETPEAPKYLILRVTKDNFDTGTHSIKNDFLSTTYKEDLKAFRNVTDEELSTISFPDEGNNNTLEKYPVVTADLTDAQDGANSVKVLLHNSDSTTTEKYIDKKNLPYVKVRQNEFRPYASVYDVKKQKAGNFSNGYNGVTIQDYILAEGNTGKNTYSDVDTILSVSPYDYRSMQGNLLDNYKEYYVDEELTFRQEGSYKYFMRNSEMNVKPILIARYRKITHDGEIEYIKEESATYYMEVVPDGAPNNPVIIDNHGNLQVKEKPLSDSSWNVTRKTKNPEEYPKDPEKYKTIRIEENDELHDYRDMSYEIVYKMKEAFNIDDSYSATGNTLPSGYSYFQISELERKNYTYFNVDELNKTPADKWHVVDMFFTTKRANWID